MINVQPVILCGGSGSRLWPLSRKGFPKQFLCLNGETTLFQQVALRLSGLANDKTQIGDPIVVTGEEHRFLVMEQLREAGINMGETLLEPIPRNTAPALTLAALAAIESGSDPVLLVSPADQTINDPDSFSSAMHAAIEEAVSDAIIVLGVVPSRPEIGYGYIKAQSADDEAITKVLEFVEKPELIRAESYVAKGDYFWNSGIFVIKASVWMKAINFFRKDIAEMTIAAWKSRSADLNFFAQLTRLGADQYESIPSESIDRAVLEKCPSSKFPIKMVPLNAGWSDVGSWNSIWDTLHKDEHDNACIGDVITTGSSNNLVHATNRLVALVDLSDIVVVETADAVLVVSKSSSQKVKKIVDQLQVFGREEHLQHRKVHRPWGWYDNIHEGDGFKVKRIWVEPGGRLSLQKHNHRAEHWVVVSGTAEITKGESTQVLTQNQSTYIRVGEIHRLVNPGPGFLEIIEVQSGDYLEEDDIVRIDDIYGR